MGQVTALRLHRPPGILWVLHLGQTRSCRIIMGFGRLCKVVAGSESRGVGFSNVLELPMHITSHPTPSPPTGQPAHLSL